MCLTSSEPQRKQPLVKDKIQSIYTYKVWSKSRNITRCHWDEEWQYTEIRVWLQRLSTFIYFLLKSKGRSTCSSATEVVHANLVSLPQEPSTKSCRAQSRNAPNSAERRHGICVEKVHVLHSFLEAPQNQLRLFLSPTVYFLA